MDFKTIFFCCQFLFIINEISCQKEEAPLLKQEVYRPPPPRILSHTQAQSHDGGFKFAYKAENGLAQSEVIAPDGTRNGGYSYVDSQGKKISVRYTAGKDGFKILNNEDYQQQPEPQQQNYQNYEPQPRQYPQKQYISYEAQHNYQPNTVKQHLGLVPSKSFQFTPPKTVKSQYQYVPSKPSGPIKLNYQYVPTKPAPIKANYQYIPAKPELPIKTHYQYIPKPPPQQYQYAPEGSAQGEPQVKRDAPAQDENTVEQEEIEPEYNDEPGQPYSFGTGYSFTFTN